MKKLSSSMFLLLVGSFGSQVAFSQTQACPPSESLGFSRDLAGIRVLARAIDSTVDSSLCLYRALDAHQVGGCERFGGKLMRIGGVRSDAETKPTFICARQGRASASDGEVVSFAAIDLAADGFGGLARKFSGPSQTFRNEMSRDVQGFAIPGLAASSSPSNINVPLGVSAPRNFCPVNFSYMGQVPLRADRNPLLGWSLVTLNQHANRYGGNAVSGLEMPHNNAIVCEYGGVVTQEQCFAAGGVFRTGPAVRSPGALSTSASNVTICATSNWEAGEVVLQVGTGAFDFSTSNLIVDDAVQVGPSDVSYNINQPYTGTLNKVSIQSPIPDNSTFNFLQSIGNYPADSAIKNLCPPVNNNDCGLLTSDLPFGFQVPGTDFLHPNAENYLRTGTGPRCSWNRTSTGDVKFSKLVSASTPASRTVTAITTQVNSTISLPVRLSAAAVSNLANFQPSSRMKRIRVSPDLALRICKEGTSKMRISPADTDSQGMISLVGGSDSSVWEGQAFTSIVRNGINPLHGSVVCDNNTSADATISILKVNGFWGDNEYMASVNCSCSKWIYSEETLPAKFVEKIRNDQGGWDNQSMYMRGVASSGSANYTLPSIFGTSTPQYQAPSQCVRKTYVPVIQN